MYTRKDVYTCQTTSTTMDRNLFDSDNTLTSLNMDSKHSTTITQGQIPISSQVTQPAQVSPKYALNLHTYRVLSFLKELRPIQVRTTYEVMRVSYIHTICGCQQPEALQIAFSHQTRDYIKTPKYPLKTFYPWPV